MTATTKPVFASKTFKYVCIKFAAHKVKGGQVWHPLQGYHISVIILRFQPPLKGVCNQLYAAVFRCMNPFIYCFCHIYLYTYIIWYMVPYAKGRCLGHNNLHYVWDLITNRCPRCLLLAILCVPYKQFSQTSGPIKSVTSWLIASFHDNGGIREYRAHQDLLKVQKKTSVCWVRYALSG